MWNDRPPCPSVHATSVSVHACLCRLAEWRDGECGNISSFVSKNMAIAMDDGREEPPSLEMWNASPLVSQSHAFVSMRKIRSDYDAMVAEIADDDDMKADCLARRAAFVIRSNQIISSIKTSEASEADREIDDGESSRTMTCWQEYFREG